MHAFAARTLFCLGNPPGPESPARLGFKAGQEQKTSRGSMTDTAFLRQLEGFALTTAEIIYRLPDHQMLLQSYIWQDYDLAPRFPKLIDFLDSGWPISTARSTACWWRIAG